MFNGAKDAETVRRSRGWPFASSAQEIPRMPMGDFFLGIESPFQDSMELATFCRKRCVAGVTAFLEEMLVKARKVTA